jgi:hypothetical protein
MNGRTPSESFPLTLSLFSTFARGQNFSWIEAPSGHGRAELRTFAFVIGDPHGGWPTRHCVLHKTESLPDGRQAFLYRIVEGLLVTRSESSKLGDTITEMLASSKRGAATAPTALPSAGASSPDESRSAGAKSGRLEKFSMTATQAILYFDSIAPRDSFEVRYRLRAKYPIHAQAFASRVYEYYDPNINATAKPVRFEVRGR